MRGWVVPQPGDSLLGGQIIIQIKVPAIGLDNFGPIDRPGRLAECRDKFTREFVLERGSARFKLFVMFLSPVTDWLYDVGIKIRIIAD